MEISQIAPEAKKIKENIEKLIVGKGEVIELVLAALLAGGHVLLEDVPGTGKTMLSKALAKSLEGAFKRIQFTPDLLPSDVTGLNYFHQKEQDFVFRPGPVFSNVILADEINRATPRTQSALLECMEERQVTIDGTTRVLESLFFVIATENPIESAGTFPLPQAQLDRFFMKLFVGFPDGKSELDMLQRFMREEPFRALQPVCSIETVIDMQNAVKQVYVHEELQKYLLEIVRATRASSSLLFGVSPRGSLAFLRCAQAYAAICGRTYVVPEDIKYLARPVLAHRVVPAASYEEQIDGGRIICELVEQIEVPVEDFRGC